MYPFCTLPDWVELEHNVATILAEQERHGWYFDERAAWKLASSLEQELRTIEKEVLRRHAYVAGKEFTPKRDNKTSGYVSGATFTRLTETNITSRDHISWILQNHYDWKPDKLTKEGKAVIDEPVLKEIGSEISMLFLRALTVTKMLGMLSNGVNAWLKLVTKSSRIHHHCSITTNTHRAGHRKPNISQTPSDHEIRQLFKPSPGLVMVGADLKSIELRVLAHLLGRFDNGRYAEILLNGDIHQVNADAIGISRKQVKTITYGWLYGQSDTGIGLSFDSSLTPEKAKKKGAEIRDAFVKAIPGMDRLLAGVNAAAQRGYIFSIDRRKIVVDSKHKCLNYICQSSAGVISRRWLYQAYELMKEKNLKAHQLGYIHDELQYECDPKHSPELKFILEYTARTAGEYYNLRCPIEAEATQGKSWAETH